MADNEVPQTPQEKRYGWTPQTTWGTAELDSVAFTQLDCEPIEIEPDIKEREIPIAHATRTQVDSNIMLHQHGSAPSLTLPLIAKHDELDYIFYSAMGAVTEGESTPYSKTLIIPATQPNFGADAGLFMTLIERDPTASQSTKIADCVVKQVDLILEKGQPLKVNAMFQGRGAPLFTANPSGTWTRSALDLWEFEDLVRATINFGAGAKSFHLESFKLSIQHDFELIGQTGATAPVGCHADIALTNRKLTWGMKIVKDSTDFPAALTNWSGNTPVDINVGWGNATPGTVDGDLDFAIHGKINAAPKDHGAIMAGDLSGVCLENDAGTTEAVTIILANAVDRAW